MTDFEIRRYDSDRADTWDDFVRRSKNGTFLFQRGFMDYHADRFSDHSLMIYEGDALLAVLPLNQSDEALVSHGGLTYGGIVSGSKMSATRMLGVFDALEAYMRKQGIGTMLYKPVPHIYHAQPAEEDLYALFTKGAELIRVDASATIALPRRLPFGSRRVRALRKACKSGLEVRESTDWAQCWALLTQVLSERHDVKPTHSLEEIQLLNRRFPAHIRLVGAFDGTEMISALVIFDCGDTIHAQYIASSEQGRRNGGVDLIVQTLVETDYADRQWFDFGISTSDQGRTLNDGLSQQKEMFGARTTVYQQFRWQL